MNSWSGHINIGIQSRRRCDCVHCQSIWFQYSTLTDIHSRIKVESADNNNKKCDIPSLWCEKGTCRQTRFVFNRISALLSRLKSIEIVSIIYFTNEMKNNRHSTVVNSIVAEWQDNCCVAQINNEKNKNRGESQEERKNQRERSSGELNNDRKNRNRNKRRERKERQKNERDGQMWGYMRVFVSLSTTTQQQQ